jgi:putative ABC transport system permease protein
MPGVASVTLANGVPPSGGSIHFSEHFEAEGGQSSDRLLILPDTSIAPGYFATLGIPIVDGRAFRADEPDDSVIISQGMAERFWPGQSPVGRRLRVFAGGPWRTVVGVAAEVRQMGIADSRPTQVRARRDHETAFEMYSPLWSGPERAPSAVARPGGPRVFSQATFIVRAGNPIALVPSIKAAVRALDRDQPIGQVALVEHLMSDSIKEQRFALVLMTSFAGLALVLAAAGLYAVLAHIVLQRRQEIGIRVALGAAAGDVLRLIVSRGAGLAAAGLALGLASAFALSRYIGSQLYEVSAHDPASFAAVASTLMAVAVLACWLPTRRALAVEPAEALRAE